MSRKTWIAWLQAAAAALQFLTRLPVPYRFDYTPRVFRQSVVFYPLVGWVIGLLLVLFAYAAGSLLPAGPVAVLTLALWVGLTGGLHLDGWMDAADGLLSHRSPERMLEIMKDSRVGAMGVIAAVLLLLGKYSLIAALLYNSAGTVPSMPWAFAKTWPRLASLNAPLIGLAIIPIWSRWWMVVCMAGWPYARKESGLGSLFREVGWFQAGASWGMAALTTFLLIGLSAAVGGPHALVSVVAFGGIAVCAATLLCLLCGWPAARTVSRKLGGLTGDLYGAMNEGLEAILLLAVVAACTWAG